MAVITRTDKINVDNVYTLKGTAFGTMTDIRYIQLSRSWNTCRPIINTRIAYSLNNLVVFETKGDAENFIEKFMKSSERKNKYPIIWDVVPYKMNKKCEYEFKELNDKEYGRYCVLSEIRC